MSLLLRVLLVLIALPVLTAAQATTPGTQARDQAPEAVAEASPQQPSRNVRVEVTVIETGGGAPPSRKTAATTLASGRTGSIRADFGSARREGEPSIRANLSMDVRPVIEQGDRILTWLTLNYSSRTAAHTGTLQPLLQSGKVTIASEAEDPTSDRKITVEVTATILE